MADTKTTGLTANTDPLLTDITYMVDDPGGSALSQKITMANLQGLMAAGMYPGGRLTLTTATPVTTADVTGAATLYYTPYIHDNIRLYDGTTWRTVTFTEKSITLVGATASKPYDIWGYLSAGTLALEKLIWTDATNRATALAYQNGRLVKSGDATRLYLGTIYINSSGGQTDDSATKRNVWNYYNRRLRFMYKADGTAHNYTTGAYRSWNNDAANRVEFVLGVLEDPFTAYITGEMDPSGDGVVGYVSIGLDVTNANSLNIPGRWSLNQAGVYNGQDSRFPAAAGFHFLQAEEYGATTVNFVEVYLRATIWG